MKYYRRLLSKSSILLLIVVVFLPQMADAKDAISTVIYPLMEAFHYYSLPVLVMVLKGLGIMRNFNRAKMIYCSESYNAGMAGQKF